MPPLEFERHEIAKALFDEIKRAGGEDYVAVRIRGETLWEVVRPRSHVAMADALSTIDQSAAALRYCEHQWQAERAALLDRIERLRRIVARYGNRVPMAMCHRPDWQHEIDRALEYVANHPSDSGSDRNGGDAVQQAAPGEASQSGDSVAGASPNLSPGDPQ